VLAHLKKIINLNDSLTDFFIELRSKLLNNSFIDKEFKQIIDAQTSKAFYEFE